jgi:hypothetical protein
VPSLNPCRYCTKNCFPGHTCEEYKKFKSQKGQQNNAELNLIKIAAPAVKKSAPEPEPLIIDEDSYSWTRFLALKKEFSKNPMIRAWYL